MDLLTISDIARIARRDAGAIHVSLFLPTHRSGAGIEQDRIRWRNLLVDAEGVLQRIGLRRTDAADLLSHAWELHADELFWEHLSDGLTYFVGPSWRQFFRVPTDLPEIGAVGDRFVVGPLLRLLTGDSRFLLLALSQNRVRLLEGSRHRIDEVHLRDVPTSLQEVIEFPEPRSDAMARRTSGRGAAGRANAIFYGYGAADKRFKKTEVEQFLRAVSTGLHEYLRDEQIPMVLAGVDYLIPIYRQVSTYQHVLDDALVGNYDDASPTVLHEQAWPIMREKLRRKEREAIDRFHELHGTGLATDDLDEIEEAAAAGRVDTLLLGDEPGCWGSPDGSRVIELGSGPSLPHCELLDRAAVGTLFHRGRVLNVPTADLPGGEVAAIMRY